MSTYTATEITAIITACAILAVIIFFIGYMTGHGWDD